MRFLIIAALALPLGGCIAKTAVDVATLPVKAASATVDAASATVDVLTTSQSEADRKLGRKIRKRDECIGKEERRARRQNREPDTSRCG